MGKQISEPTSQQIQYLAFDVGSTLVKVFPEYTGPLYKWPQVIAIDGIHETLERLREEHSLIVITNAAESGAQQIRTALKRCGLDSYFNHIYTSKELKLSKPEPEFFHHIERTLEIRSENIIMVGDSFANDISGAFRAGWKSIWYNPNHTLCPGLIPFHTAEINHMDELVKRVDHLDFLEINQCFALLAEHGASFNIFQHVLAVASVSYVLASWMKKNGVEVDPVLAHRGGLLHDLAKLHETLNRTKNHGELAADILNKLNQPLLARIAQSHLLSSILDKARKPQSWEEKIVYLADKLVEGNKIVSIQERLTALKQRYGIGDHYDIPLNEMLDEFCNTLGISPKALITRIKTAFYFGKIMD